MSAEVETFEGIKTLLSKSKQCGAIKVDLFTHITEIVNKIVSHHKYDAYQKFEEISLLIKKTQLKVKNPLTSDQLKNMDENSACKALDKLIEKFRDVISDKISTSEAYKGFINKNHQ